MKPSYPTACLAPPPGRPSWAGDASLPLVYLGWGHRDYRKNPLPMHYDLGSNYFFLSSGSVLVHTNKNTRVLRAPSIAVTPRGTAFGISQTEKKPVQILVWVWSGPPLLRALSPRDPSLAFYAMRQKSVKVLQELHVQCRREVVEADSYLEQTLPALRCLLEAEIARNLSPTPGGADTRWALIQSWMRSNLSIHNPVPALCDYLGISASTLHRIFVNMTGTSPGTCFREIKKREARRLIEQEGWQVKAAAFHLGYKHPNDLSRALRNPGPICRANHSAAIHSGPGSR